MFAGLSTRLLAAGSLVLVACQPAAPAPPTSAAQPAAAPVSTPVVAAAAPTVPAATSQPTTVAASTTAVPVKGGTFVDTSIVDAKTMQPLLAQDTGSLAFIALQYDAPLLRTDPKTLDPMPFAARSYTISDDKLTITYKLRDDLLWSDGQKITSADYKFTWDRMMDEKVNFPYRKLFQDYFTSLTAPDDATLVFQLKEVFAPALLYSGIDAIPKHVFENLDINDNPRNNNPTVGSGPFLLKQWRKDEFAEFAANDHFFLGRPNLDSYLIKIVPDVTVEYSQFKSQEIDAVAVQPQDWEEARNLPFAQPLNYYSANASWSYLAINLRNPILADRRVRYAISGALDRQSMIQAVRLGHAKPLDGPYASASWAYEPDVLHIAYDPAASGKLLDEAGWAINPATGVRERDGNPLKLRIHYGPPGNKQREQIATIVQQQLKNVGIELEIIPEDFNAFLDRTGKTHDFDLTVAGWGAGIDPHASRNLWVSDGGQNETGFQNPEVDRLYDQAVRVYDQSERKKFYSQIQKLIAQEQPYVFLWENESLFDLNNRIVLPYAAGETKTSPIVDPWRWYSKTGQ
ncbi:MAG TPA: ABC transporter substrate-binding protein [Chloroflexota bacterium]|nr:ABC transporter substrate-binding protein [Chloroflexota bacterium]